MFCKKCNDKFGHLYKQEKWKIDYVMDRKGLISPYCHGKQCYLIADNLTSGYEIL